VPRRVSQMQQMDPEKNARLAVFPASDAARDVTGQICAARHNEIFLFSHPARSAASAARKTGRRS
jgi:hypothetical protein